MLQEQGKTKKIEDYTFPLEDLETKEHSNLS